MSCTLSPFTVLSSRRKILEAALLVSTVAASAENRLEAEAVGSDLEENLQEHGSSVRLRDS